MIRVGSARTNEFGGISGGQPGDQTGHECETQSWYLHEYGWILARPRNKGVAEKMAHNMESICKNPAYGYDQPRDHDGINAAKPYGYDAELDIPVMDHIIIGDHCYLSFRERGLLEAPAGGI